MNICFLGLGSNMGDREQYLRRAVDLLRERDNLRILNVSSIYTSEPLGYTKQPDFLNIVVKVETVLTPTELLEICMSVEQRLKRIREFRWGPRTVDVDILLYDDIIINTSMLAIPHPMIAQRLFVLIPLAEVAPGLQWNGESVEERIAKIHDQEIRMFKKW